MSDYNLTAELKRCAKSMRSGYITAKDAEHYREVFLKALEWITEPMPTGGKDEQTNYTVRYRA